MSTPLNLLITEITAAGWEIRLNLRDNLHDATCLRFVFAGRREGYVHAIGRGHGQDFATALSLAYTSALTAEDLLEAGANSPTPTINLRELIKLPPAAPTITRRI